LALNSLLDQGKEASTLSYGYVIQGSRSTNLVPMMTLDQVKELVNSGRIQFPTSSPSKGVKMSEASKLSRSKKMGTSVSVYDVNRKLIAVFHSQNAAAKAYGIAIKTITKFVNNKKPFRGMYFVLGPKWIPIK